MNGINIATKNFAFCIGLSLGTAGVVIGIFQIILIGIIPSLDPILLIVPLSALIAGWIFTLIGINQILEDKETK